MTSKEMKERLSKRPNPHNLYAFNEEQVKELIKDLEILETLKRILKPTYEEICGTPFMVLKTKKGNVIYEANYDLTGNELIKEWLYNDK